MTDTVVGQTHEVPGKAPHSGWGAQEGFLEEVILELRLKKIVLL